MYGRSVQQVEDGVAERTDRRQDLVARRDGRPSSRRPTRRSARRAMPRGTNGAGGARSRLHQAASSRGAAVVSVRYARRISSRRANGHAIRPPYDGRADLVQPERERGDDAEVRAGAADAPEQVGALVAARAADAPVRRHDLDLEEVVDRPAEAAGEVAQPAAERQPGDADLRDEAERRGEAVRAASRGRRPEPAAGPDVWPCRAAGSTVDARAAATCRASARARRAPCRRCCGRRPDRRRRGRASRAKSTAAATSAAPVGLDDERGDSTDRRRSRGPRRSLRTERTVSARQPQRAEQSLAQRRSPRRACARTPRAARSAGRRRASITWSGQRGGHSSPRRRRAAWRGHAGPTSSAVGAAMRSSPSGGMARTSRTGRSSRRSPAGVGGARPLEVLPA